MSVWCERVHVRAALLIWLSDCWWWCYRSQICTALVMQTARWCLRMQQVPKAFLVSLSTDFLDGRTIFINHVVYSVVVWRAICRVSYDLIYALGYVVFLSAGSNISRGFSWTVIEQIAGRDNVLNHNSVPAACFTHPEISMVGLTEVWWSICSRSYYHSDLLLNCVWGVQVFLHHISSNHSWLFLINGYIWAFILGPASAFWVSRISAKWWELVNLVVTILLLPGSHKREH